MKTVISQPVLKSEQILLRPFDTDDAPVMFPLINDRQIASNTLRIPYPYPEENAVKWIDSHKVLWEEGKSAIFAICGIATNQHSDLKNKPLESAGVVETRSFLVGAIGLEIDPKNENAEMGYWVGRDFWNRGYCSAACRLMIRFGFEQLELQRVHAHHMTRNPASGRVLEKAGMTREGLLRKHIKKWGVFEDISFFGILRSDFDGND